MLLTNILYKVILGAKTRDKIYTFTSTSKKLYWTAKNTKNKRKLDRFCKIKINIHRVCMITFGNFS